MAYKPAHWLFIGPATKRSLTMMMSLKCIVGHSTQIQRVSVRLMEASWLMRGYK